MADIYLYNNHDDPIVADKFLAGLGSTSGEFRATVDVLRPTFTIKSGTDNASANYCELPDFGRYYYITGRRKLTTGLTELSLYCDVRKTFLTQLRGNFGIVERQERNYDMYLNDDKIPTGARKTVSIYTFSDTPFTGGNDNRVIMRVLGG